MAEMKDLTGIEFGKLTALDVAGYDARTGQEMWNCSCECGGMAVVYRYSLLSGNTKSCGCQGGRRRVSELSLMNESRGEYKIWAAMRSRCTNPNTTAFIDYGGRGVTVCDRWLDSFDSFLEDMGPKPKGYSLDRIDVNKGYSPENCRWASWNTQANNRRNTIYIEFKGESHSISEWAEILGTRWANIYQRLRISSPEETIQYYLDKKTAGKNSVPVRLNKPIQLKSDGSSVFYVGRNMDGSLVVQTLDKKYLEVSLEDLQNTPYPAKRSSSVKKKASSEKASALYSQQETAQVT